MNWQPAIASEQRELEALKAKALKMAQEIRKREMAIEFMKTMQQKSPQKRKEKANESHD